MPQLVKKRRSGWAVLAAGALIASVLAFGATPAIAAEQVADAQATWKACLGPALEDRGFTDVSMDSSHYDAINCLAYYGISAGKTADTYDPGSHITRSQMALFLTNAAAKAGIELEEAMDMGFTDLGSTGDNRVAAINLLASKGIMPGRTATTFDPTGYVTRADMAQHLFTLLDLALDSLLIDMLPDSVETNPRDGVGMIEHSDFDGDGRGTRVDDYFGDVRRTLPAHTDDIIGAVYELGITAGTNGMVGENGEFSPGENVTRGQMATFIMAALNHTNLRPAGLTAQQTRDDTQVSVRDADFKPVVNARVEVFNSHFADEAFDGRGRCINRFVTASDPSFDDCEIDAGDARTEVDGNVELKPGLGGGRATIICSSGAPYADDDGAHTTTPQPDQFAAEGRVKYLVDAMGLVDPEINYKLWAWTGSFGDAVDSDTDLFEAVPANRTTGLNPAVSAVLSGGTTAPKVGMGSSLVYEIQLVDYLGIPVGPNPTGNQDYTVTVRKQQVSDAGTAVPGTVQITSLERRSPDHNGHIRIVVHNPDPVIGVDNNDVEVSVTVQRHPGTGATGDSANMLRFVDTTGATAGGTLGFEATGVLIREATGAATSPSGTRIIGAQAPVETFSDDAPVATSVRVSPKAAGRILSSADRNSIAVTVLDQYNNPYRAGQSGYRAASTVVGGSPTGSLFSNGASRSAAATSDGSGRVFFAYDYVQAAPGTETVTITGTGTTVDSTAKVYWANISGPGDGSGPLSLADPSTRTLYVTPIDEVPSALRYGADDNFLVVTTSPVVTTELSLEQFQEVLIVANSPDPRISFTAATTLTWEGFNNNRPNDRATWTLTGLMCNPPAGANEEPT